MAGKEKEAKKEENKEKEKLMTAVYKSNLHCPECAREIKRPLLRTQGVQTVEVDMKKGEIKAKGDFDPIKIQKRIEKMTKKKIELISPSPDQIKSVTQTEKKVIKETKQPITRTTSFKVHMHCDQCARDLQKKLLMQKGVHSVKTDVKAQILTVDGTMEPEKLVSFLRRKVHKHAEIVADKKEEKKEIIKAVEEKKESGKPAGGKPAGPPEKTVESFKEEIKVVEVKNKEGESPYFIHYVYAPQLFSDENPNACTIS